MDWFKAFYETDYYKYYFEPKLRRVPRAEVGFILEKGRLDFDGRYPPRVFDICCGIGRHARPLAAAGCEVIGVDLSAANITAARQRAQEEGIAERCRFELGDIRAYEPPSNCDLAINIFTSFGYFETDDENAVILDRAARSLRPGGRLILDVANREAIIAGFKKRERRGTRDNYVIEQCELDLARGRAMGLWTFVRGKHRSEHRVSIRLYALHELIAMAERHEMRFVEAYGSFDGEPYDRLSPRCIFVAERA